jgi:hypothetical protein
MPRSDMAPHDQHGLGHQADEVPEGVVGGRGLRAWSASIFTEWTRSGNLIASLDG